MKKYLVIIFILCAAALLCAGTVYADEIHLNDGTVIKGKIIQVTEKAIEYDPEGDEPFAMIPRGQIFKIVYDSGNVVVLNEGAGKTPGTAEEKSRETGRRSGKGVHEHDGFFFRTQLGFGQGRSVVDFQTQDLTVKGPSTTLNFQFGYAIFDNFILHIDNGASVMSGAKASGGVPTGIDNKTDVTISTFGAGASYYFMPVNIYISPSILLSSMTFDGNVIDGDSNGGWGATLAIGKEWWVSDNWGLGVALFAYYGKDTVTVTVPVKQDYDVVNTVFGVMFTATYN